MVGNKKQQKRNDAIKKMRDWQKSQSDAYRTYIKTSAVGLEFGLAIVVGALLGYFVDRYFSISPYGLLIGVVIGTIAAVKRLWVFVKSYVEKDESHDDK